MLVPDFGARSESSAHGAELNLNIRAVSDTDNGKVIRRGRAVARANSSLKGLFSLGVLADI